MSFKQKSDNIELELIRAMSESTEGKTHNSESCWPDDPALRRFLKGRADKHEASLILSHLGYCATCTARMRRFRSETEARRRLIFAFAGSFAVILLAVFAMRFRAKSPDTFVVDLREMPLSRGIEPPQSPVVIPRDTKNLKLLMAIGSEGHYDLTLSNAGGPSSVWTGNGEAVVDRDAVALAARTDFRGLPKGLYTLNLERSGTKSHFKIKLE